MSYDCNGNLTYDGTLTYGYDAENRLMTASKTGLAVAYQYDPLGRRTRKSGTGVTGTFYLSDGTDEIAEYDGTSGTLTTRYIPGPAIDEPVAMVDGATGTKTYFHTNHQGSVIAMSGTGAALTEGPYTYDPYGNCFLGATQTPCSSSGEPYRFTGRRFDPETGLLYYRARYYDSNKGRFLQTDPVGYTADLNLYTYVGNDPTNKTDPSGNGPEIVACAAAGPGAGVCAGLDLALTATAVVVAPVLMSGPTKVEPSKKNDDKKNASNKEGPNKSGKNTPPPGTQGPRFFRGKLRETILDKTKNESGEMECGYCDQKMTNKPGQSNSATTDHIKAYSKGGKTSEGNGQGACLSCNLSKYDKDLGTEWTPPNQQAPEQEP